MKKHDERWWPVLLQARLTSLEEVEECLATFGLSRTEVHGRLCAFAALPAHGGLLSPAAVFERERGAIDLGSGKRVLEPGGRLDSTYNITVPREMGDA